MKDFTALDIEHRDIFKRFFRLDPPLISEYTFTNLFMWRQRYKPRWRVRRDCLLLVMEPEPGCPFGLPPAGLGDKREALEFLAQELLRRTSPARICRVPEGVVASHADPERFEIQADRDNSDYVYSSIALAQLSGRKYHKKKNQLNKFIKAFSYDYRELDRDLVGSLLDMQAEWCGLRDCEADATLRDEDSAIRQALMHREQLGFSGAAVLIDGRVEAFSLGEPLNPETAVIHIEKANPLIPGLYAAINQLFCANAWPHTRYINREQDLGIEGLRRAKESYHPEHLVLKYTLTLK